MVYLLQYNRSMKCNIQFHLSGLNIALPRLYIVVNLMISVYYYNLSKNHIANVHDESNIGWIPLQLYSRNLGLYFAIRHNIMVVMHAASLLRCNFPYRHVEFHVEIISIERIRNTMPVSMLVLRYELWIWMVCSNYYVLDIVEFVWWVVIGFVPRTNTNTTTTNMTKKWRKEKHKKNVVKEYWYYHNYKWE